MSISLSFHGAAGTVTGSRHLLTAGDTQVLVDCGQFQGLKELRELNWRPPAFDLKALDAVILTHAHIDHSGYLPRLVKDGYRGPVYATPATIELAGVLLMDAARLQEEDADYANRKGFSRHRPALPLFTEDDAERALRLMRPVDFGAPVQVGATTSTFHNAGHILGSAHVEMRARDGDERTTVVFSGDIGRYGVPLHADPSPPPPCDTLVLESTYGDRDHEPGPLADQLRGAIRQTLERGGTVLIPAFAVARAQLLTLLLGRLMAAGEIPQAPIDLDSPMAVDVSRIYARHAKDEGIDADVAAHPSQGLNPPSLRYHRTVDESRALNEAKGPRVIVSSSGMLTGGRVLHHLRRLAGDRRNLILLAGYQAAGTRGRALLEGARQLKVHGEFVQVRARIVSLEGFSAHADRDEVVRWVTSGESLPETVFLVHGEPSATRGLRDVFRERHVHTMTPGLGSRYSWMASSRRWREDEPGFIPRGA